MRNIFILISAIVFWSSCKQSVPTVNPDRSSMFRTGRWRVTSGTVTLNLPNGADTTMDYMQFIPTCHLDDYIAFDSLNHAAVFPGPITCSPADPDSISFVWNLYNNGNNMNIKNVYNFFYSVLETINTPYFFDTLSHSPLVFDTLQRTPYVSLDTIWTLKFVSKPVINYDSVVYGIDINSAQISNFTSKSFTLSFKWYDTYPDSTGFHTGDVLAGDLPPIIRPDTFVFVLNYVNF